MARARAVYELSAEDRASPAFAQVNAAMRQTRRLATQLGGTLVSALAGGGLARLIAKSLDGQQELGKLNRQFGVSVELLSELRGIASLTGVSWTSMVTAIRNSQKGLADAEDGIKEAQRTFRELGVDFETLGEFSPDRQILSLIDSLRNLGQGYRQSAAASRLFGFRANELNRLANISRQEFIALRIAQQRAGRSLSVDQTAAAEKASDAFDLVLQDLNALVDRFTNFLTPTITTVSNFFRGVLAPAVIVVTNQFKLLGQAIAGIARAFVFIVQGEFRQAFQALQVTLSDALANVKSTFDLVKNPLEAVDKAEAQRSLNGIRQLALDFVEEIPKLRKNGPTLFDEDFEALKRLVSSYQALSKLQDEQRGGSSELDTTLQSLAAGATAREDPITSQLKSIERLLKQRELLQVMDEIRKILADDSQTASFA